MAKVRSESGPPSRGGASSLLAADDTEGITEKYSSHPNSLAAQRERAAEGLGTCLPSTLVPVLCSQSIR